MTVKIPILFMRASRRVCFITASVLMLLLLAACGGGGGSAAPAKAEVKLTGTEFRWEPNTVQAKPSQSIKVTIINTGAVEHNFVVPAVNFRINAVPSGKSATGELKAPSAAGNYEYFCDVPGHKEAGMVGTLVVK